MLNRFGLRLTIFMSVLSIIGLLGSAQSARAAGPTIKLAVEDGATISDMVTILAKTTADDNAPIEKVEFYIDEKLRFTDQSVPYSYDWETLEESEGKHVLSATAFDAKGRTARVKIEVTIDNDLSKGVDFLSDAALKAIKSNDLELAVKMAKRSLKVAPTNLKGARALAGIHAAKGEFARSVEILIKAELPDGEIDARNELAGYLIQAGEAAGSTEDFVKNAAMAVELHKKVVALQLAAVLREPDSLNQAIKRGDAYFAARNWTSASAEYQRLGAADTAPAPVFNRILLAHLKSGRLKDAEIIARQINRAKKGDTVTKAVMGMFYLINHQPEKARDSVADGIDNNVLPAMVIGGYVYQALKQRDKAQKITADAIKINDKLPDTLIVQSFTLRDAIDAQHANIRAIELDPTTVEAYVQRAYQIMLGRDAKKFESADKLLEFAYKLEPTSTYVIMARAMSMISQKRYQEAEVFLSKMMELDPNSPDVHMALAVVLQLADKTVKITAEMNTANRLDPNRWADVFVPKRADLLDRVFRYRFAPVLTPDGLYPEKK